MEEDEVLNDFMKNAGQMSKDLLNLAFEMFQIWDENGYGRLQLSVVCDNFMALGFSTDNDITISFFKIFLDPTKDLLPQDVDLNDFLSLFKGDETI